MTPPLNEHTIEMAALAWLEALGYEIYNGADIAPGAGAWRKDYTEAILPPIVQGAIAKLNPHLAHLPADVRKALFAEAYRAIAEAARPNLADENRAKHRLLTDGVSVEYPREDGTIAGDKVYLVDWETPTHNRFMAIHQFTVQGTHNGTKQDRRADIVIFINGLPIAVMELKNPTSEAATLASAWRQLQTYKADIPALFAHNALLVVSDGVLARMGTLTANMERFMPWRTVDGTTIAPNKQGELHNLIKGVFAPAVLLDLLRHFIVFEDDGGAIAKKVAGYHQYHAVNKAVTRTVEAVHATTRRANQRAGVIWHTQGSGKSLAMLFYAAKISKHAQLSNPTVVLLTDRNDLDAQLFATFGRAKHLLRQTPKQAESREELQDLLTVASGGVIFTTIQKFAPKESDTYPKLSDRRNIIIIADEAHRSQYDFIKGYARHLREGLPNASFIGFTATPIALADKNTEQVFGDVIDHYGMQRAVEDGATVPIYYESRMLKISLSEEARAKLDAGFEEIAEDMEEEQRTKAQKEWAAIEKVVGTDARIADVAHDMAKHWQARVAVMAGKAMIVCMSRRICVAMYEAIVKLHPEWHSADDAKGAIKVVMTGKIGESTNFDPHIRSKKGNETIARRFKDADDDLQLVIVRDMWLTGFDAPCAHTMYVDKPMKGHNLMQAIARVNRVFQDKPGGLIVDYLGISAYLQAALQHYGDDDRQSTAIPEDAAVAEMMKRYQLVQSMLTGFDKGLDSATQNKAQTIERLQAAMDHILAPNTASHAAAQKGEDTLRARFMRETLNLKKAHALCPTSDEAAAIREDIRFFLSVRAALVKMGEGRGHGAGGLDVEGALQALISKAIAPTGVVDIFAVAGIKQPDISILDDAFLAEVRGMTRKNLGLEMLRTLLNDEIKQRSRTNLVQAQKFSERLADTVQKYQNRLIKTAEVIDELINLAKDMRQATERGEALGLNDDETAFYDALADNESAEAVLGDKQLCFIARELAEKIRNNASIDWAERDSVRAKMRLMVKRILRHYGYPPDLQEAATETVIEQAELLSEHALTR